MKNIKKTQKQKICFKKKVQNFKKKYSKSIARIVNFLILVDRIVSWFTGDDSQALDEGFEKKDKK